MQLDVCCQDCGGTIQWNSRRRTSSFCRSQVKIIATTSVCQKKSSSNIDCLQIHPRRSMYAIYANIDPQNTPIDERIWQSHGSCLGMSTPSKTQRRPFKRRLRHCRGGNIHQPTTAKRQHRLQLQGWRLQHSFAGEFDASTRQADILPDQIGA